MRAPPKVLPRALRRTSEEEEAHDRDVVTAVRDHLSLVLSSSHPLTAFIPPSSRSSLHALFIRMYCLATPS
jgi:hypothetical protein